MPPASDGSEPASRAPPPDGPACAQGLWNEYKNRKKPANFVQKALVPGEKSSIFALFFHLLISTILDCDAPAAALPQARFH
jgi:hypothetical protein